MCVGMPRVCTLVLFIISVIGTSDNLPSAVQSVELSEFNVISFNVKLLLSS